MKQAISLYLALVFWAVWIGGFVFYFGIVVPLGGKLAGGTLQGFITQQVTYWQNVLGIASLVVFLVFSVLNRSRVLLGSWAVMAACLVALFVMHGQLAGLVDVNAREVTSADRFYTLHERYEAIASVLWLAGMVYLGGVVKVIMPR